MRISQSIHLNGNAENENNTRRRKGREHSTCGWLASDPLLGLSDRLPSKCRGIGVRTAPKQRQKVRGGSSEAGAARGKPVNQPSRTLRLPDMPVARPPLGVYCGVSLVSFRCLTAPNTQCRTLLTSSPIFFSMRLLASSTTLSLVRSPSHIIIQCYFYEMSAVLARIGALVAEAIVVTPASPPACPSPSR